MSGDAFPLPAPGYMFPDRDALWRWGGYGKGDKRTSETFGDLKRAWIAEMESAGWVLVWLDPATGEIASRT